MYKLILAIVFLAGSVTAQKKPSAPKNVNAVKVPKKSASESRVDSFPVEDLSNPQGAIAEPDTMDREYQIRKSKKFAVYSKKAKTKKGNTRLKLCLQLTHKDSILNYCINDSLCKDPEVAKVLFQEDDGDTTYVLVFVDAFSKPADKPSCDAGKETKLFFARWNIKTGKAIWNQRTISSCMRGITNMTKQSISDWDRNFPLIANYHRGGSSFVEITFDPHQYKLGLQTTSMLEDKSED
jgi:hypothetical protein